MPHSTDNFNKCYAANKWPRYDKQALEQIDKLIEKRNEFKNQDYSKDTLRPNGIELENKHYKLGQQLIEKVKKELGIKYKMRFSPSSTASM